MESFVFFFFIIIILIGNTYVCSLSEVSSTSILGSHCTLWDESVSNDSKKKERDLTSQAREWGLSEIRALQPCFVLW